MKSLKKNLSFQTAYQLLATMLPLITSPYLSRVLGAEQLGVFSYTNSVVQYFVLFAMLGTVNYGTRSIAGCKENHEKCAEVFWNIYVLQVITSSIMTLFYLIYLLFICKRHQLIAILQLIQIINCMLDINWLFFGLEEFKLTVTRNFIVKAITFGALFVLVKSDKDLWIYTLLMGGSTLISQFFLWSKVPTWCRKKNINWRSVLGTIKPNIALFIPLLAMSVYHIMDKTMLGILSTDIQSGYYYNADKLINIPLTIIAGFGTVLLPRITNLIESQKREQAEMMLTVSIEGVLLVATAMAFGIAAISNEFVPFFFGSGFKNCISVTIVLSPVLIVKGLSNTIRTEFLIPYHLENKLTVSVLIGAVINLLFNYLLIPKWGAVGAAFGTLIAEISSCVVQSLYIRNSMQMGKIGIEGIGYCLCGMLMFGIVRVIAHFFQYGLISIIIEILVGGIVFCFIAFLMLIVCKSRLREVLLKHNI